MTGDALREAVAVALGGAGVHARDPATTFTPYPAPFLVRHGIWALDHAGEDAAFWLFVGWAPGAPARLLTGRPDEFVALARADGVALATPAQAIAYALAYLHTTRPATPLTTVLRSLGDLPAVPAPTGDEQLRLAVLVRRHGAALAPSARAAGDGHAVVVHVARDRELVRVRLQVALHGGVAATEETVERGLPMQAAGPA